MENYNYNNENESEMNEQEVQNFSQEDQSQEDGGMFKLASVIVILGIVVFGGYYLWTSLSDKVSEINSADSSSAGDVLITDNAENVAPGSVVDEAIQDVKDPVADKLSTQGNSDNIDDIEADLNASDLGDVNLDNLGF